MYNKLSVIQLLHDGFFLCKIFGYYQLQLEIG